MNWEAIIDKAFNYGVPAAFLFVLFAFVAVTTWAIGRFIAPMITSGFDVAKTVAVEHVSYLRESTETMREIKNSVSTSSQSHDKTHEALLPLADAIHAAAPVTQQNEVKPHIDRVKQALQ